MPLANLTGEHHIRCYSFLHYHRTAITEGIRKISARNKGHLHRSMQAVGAVGGGFRGAANAVLDRMLKDLDLEPTKTNRRLLEYTCFTTWEIYLCLLYAELECYEDVARKHPELRFPPLDALVARHGSFVESLRRLRNRVLHPKTAKATAVAREELRVSIDGYGLGTELVTQAQAEVDAFMRRTQDTWRERGTEAVNDLQGVEEDKLTGEHLRTLGLLEEGLKVMRRPLPVVADGENDAGEGQAFLHPRLIRRWSEELLAERPWEFGGPVPAFGRNAAFGMAFLLLSSELLVGQTMGVIDMDKLHGVENPFEYDPMMFVRPEKAPSTSQDWLDHVAPMRVRAAMMAEPVRMYREVTAKRPELRDGRIEEVLEDGVLYLVLAAFRNLVFHVMPSDGSDPDVIESRFMRWHSARLGISNPDPLGALARPLNAFYFRVGGAQAPSFIEPGATGSRE